MATLCPTARAVAARYFRRMKSADDLPENLIIFDGVCVLCSAFFRFVVKHDRHQRFHFATAQSAAGQRLYQSLGLPTDHFETVLVYAGGKLYTHAQGFGAVMSVLGRPWKWLAALKYLPKWSTSWAYLLIARNRYKLFGRTDICMIPDPSLRSRFLT